MDPQTTEKRSTGGRLAPPTLQTERRALVLGLGNELRGDDAVGLRVAMEVQRRTGSRRDVEVISTGETGLALLDFFEGRTDVVIIDAVATGRAAPGTIYRLDGDALPELRGAAPHALGVGEILALGWRIGLAMPRRVTLLAVEVADASTIGAELSPSVRAALPTLVERVLTELG